MEAFTLSREQAGRLQGLVRVPAGVGRREIQVLIERTDVEPDATSRRSLAFRPPAFDAGRFPAGIYRIALGPWPRSEPWVQRENVDVQLGRITTLRDLDLTHLWVLKLTSTGPWPRPLEWQSADGAWTDLGWATLPGGSGRC